MQYNRRVWRTICLNSHGLFTCVELRYNAATWKALKRRFTPWCPSPHGLKMLPPDPPIDSMTLGSQPLLPAPDCLDWLTPGNQDPLFWASKGAQFDRGPGNFLGMSQSYWKVICLVLLHNRYCRLHYIMSEFKWFVIWILNVEHGPPMDSMPGP